MHQTLSQPTTILLIEECGNDESDRSTVAHSSGLPWGFLTSTALVRTTVTKVITTILVVVLYWMLLRLRIIEDVLFWVTIRERNIYRVLRDVKLCNDQGETWASPK